MSIAPGKLFATVQLGRDVITHVNGVEIRTQEIYAENVRANVKYLGGSELWKAQQVNPLINVRVQMWYRTDILASDRVIYKGKRLEILSPPILDEEYRQSVTLQCKSSA